VIAASASVESELRLVDFMLMPFQKIC
jgi:hypothetical protein